jgi:hypothetical protein
VSPTRTNERETVCPTFKLQLFQTMLELSARIIRRQILTAKQDVPVERR